MTTEETIKDLRKLSPHLAFRKQPEHARDAILAFEAKHQLNTVDYLKGIRINELDEETRHSWINEYDTFLLFEGKDEDINSITERKG